MHAPDDYKGLKLKLDGLVPPGHGFHRNLLLDTLYTSLPRDPQVKVQIYNAEIVPGGYTNWHCHNGAAFFVALQGLFEAHFQEGVLVKAKAGECYSEPIAKFHRGHNPHPDLPYLCVSLCFLTRPQHMANSSGGRGDLSLRNSPPPLLRRADTKVPCPPHRNQRRYLAFRRGKGLEICWRIGRADGATKTWRLDHSKGVESGDLLACAKREFNEETGLVADGKIVPLRPIRQKSGKTVHAFALEADFDLTGFVSNAFEMEWPPRSGTLQRFPEVDRIAYFDVPTARQKILAAQTAFIDELVWWLKA